MSLELLSMIGGGLAGFLFRFIATQQEAAKQHMDWLLKAQAMADDSADRAANRGTHLGRRVLVFTVLWVLAVAPFIGAFFNIPTWVEGERAPWDLLGVFTGQWHELKGIIILPELRAALLAAVGFYLGGSSLAKGK